MACQHKQRDLYSDNLRGGFIKISAELSYLLFSFVVIIAQTLPAKGQIISVSPAQNALNVSTTADISVVFNQAMLPETINDTTFRVVGWQSGLHRDTIIYDTTLRKATLKPSKPFLSGEKVSVILTDNIKTLDSTSLIKFQWSFSIDTVVPSGKFDARIDYETAYSPLDAYGADYDGDGDVDLAIANYDDSRGLSIFMNNGDGTFLPRVDYETGGAGVLLSGGDLDADGDIDLVFGWYEHIAILINNGSGLFLPKQYAVPSPFFFVSDIDGDGDLDVISTNQILKNNGSATFESVLNSIQVARIGSDFDSDGDIDIVSSDGKIWLNDGNGTFQLSSQYQGFPLQAVDLDNDGDVDLIMRLTPYTIRVLKNSGDGTFNLSVDYVVQNVVLKISFADTDEDRDMDLVINGSSKVYIWDNRGDGTFQGEAEYSLPQTYQYVTIVTLPDIDQDGDADIVVVDGNNHQVSVFRNTLISVTPAFLNFRNVSLGKKSDLILSITNNGGKSLEVNNIVHSNPNFKIAGDTAYTVHQNETLLIQAFFTANILGRQSDTLRIFNSDYTNSPVEISMTAVGATTLFPEISILPFQLDFDTIAVAQTKDLTLKVFNLGASDLTVSNISSNNNRFDITSSKSFSLSPSDSSEIVVRFQPIGEEIQTGTLNILSNDANEETLKVAMKGFGTISTHVGDTISNIPQEYTLYQNYPNPFNPTTQINFTLPTESFVTLSIYDIFGRKVATLVNEQRQAGYYHEFLKTEYLSNGVYYYRLETKEFNLTKKMILLK